MEQGLRLFLKKLLWTETGCAEWQGAVSPTGYGRYRAHAAHRWAYERFIEPIPPRCHLHHLCENKLCCNPMHLQVVDPREHIHLTFRAPAALNAVKVQCKHGHHFDAANTLPTASGGRACRACGLVRQARSRKKRHPEPRPIGRPVGVNLKAHCPQGHPYDEANTRHEKPWGRKCKACDRARAKARYHARKEA